jgi:hypothetical protein
MTMAAMTCCSEYSCTLLRPALRRCRIECYPRATSCGCSLNVAVRRSRPTRRSGAASACWAGGRYPSRLIALDLRGRPFSQTNVGRNGRSAREREGTESLVGSGCLACSSGWFAAGESGATRPICALIVRMIRFHAVSQRARGRCVLRSNAYQRKVGRATRVAVARAKEFAASGHSPQSPVQAPTRRWTGSPHTSPSTPTTPPRLERRYRRRGTARTSWPASRAHSAGIRRSRS